MRNLHEGPPVRTKQLPEGLHTRPGEVVTVFTGVPVESQPGSGILGGDFRRVNSPGNRMWDPGLMVD